MAETSAIEWTDATWNPITGCSVISPGCTHCYAMKLAGTRLRNNPSRQGLTVDSKAGPVWTGEVRFNDGTEGTPDFLTDPLRWRRPRRIFVCAHADLFHESVPDAWIDRIFAVMALAPQHTFQLLTKRAERMRAYVGALYRGERQIAACALDFGPGKSDEALHRLSNGDFAPYPPLPNVWLGVSAEDQERADQRIPHLLATPAAVRFLSCEPLLGPIDLNHIKMIDCETPGGGRETAWESALNGIRYDIWAGDDEDPNVPGFPRIDWVIAGGESGRGARPMHPDWARSLRDQCAAAEVAFLFKQWGAWAPDGIRFRTSGRAGEPGSFDNLLSSSGRFMVAWTADRDGLAKGDQLKLVSKKAAGRLLDGVEHNGMPELADA